MVRIFSCGKSMAKDRFAAAVTAGELESVTLKVSGVALVTALGVPLIHPVEALSERPDGKVPAVNCQV